MRSQGLCFWITKLIKHDAIELDLFRFVIEKWNGSYRIAICIFNLNFEYMGEKK